MFKRKALKLYRKANRIEQEYGSAVADKILFARIWYKIYIQQKIKVMFKLHKKSKANHILFEAETDFSGNPRALYDYMIAEGYNHKYKITWIVNDPNEFRQYKAHNVRFIRRYHPKNRFREANCYKAALKARYVFFAKYFNFLETKSAGQICVNMQLGGDWKLTSEKERELIQFDYCLAPGKAFVKPKAKEFSCPAKKILPIGEARYRQFYSGRSEAEAFYQKLCGSHTNLKTVFWMPLYRKAVLQTWYRTGIASMTGLPLIHSIMDVPKLDEICQRAGIHLLIYCNSDMETLRKEAGDSSHISFVAEDALREADVQVYELLPKADALLSDYASVAIDYLLLDRPIGYVLEDFGEFERANGFLFPDPLTYMPGAHIRQMEDLEQFFLQIAKGEDEFKEQRAALRAKTHNETDDYCKRILDQFGILK